MSTLFCLAFTAFAVVVNASTNETSLNGNSNRENSKLGSYKINHVSVSGLSSGGYFAVQFHVAHSSIINGAAIFAAGPFYCAEGNLVDAENRCMKNLFGGPPVSALVELTNSDFALGLVDDPSNLKDDRVYIFSGKDDTVVDQAVVKSLQSYYSNYVKASNIVSDYNIEAEHCFPTVNYGEGTHRPQHSHQTYSYRLTMTSTPHILQHCNRLLHPRLALYRQLQFRRRAQGPREHLRLLVAGGLSGAGQPTGLRSDTFLYEPARLHRRRGIHLRADLVPERTGRVQAPCLVPRLSPEPGRCRKCVCQRHRLQRLRRGQRHYRALSVRKVLVDEPIQPQRVLGLVGIHRRLLRGQDRGADAVCAQASAGGGRVIVYVLICACCCEHEVEKKRARGSWRRNEQLTLRRESADVNTALCKWGCARCMRYTAWSSSFLSI